MTLNEPTVTTNTNRAHDTRHDRARHIFTQDDLQALLAEMDRLGVKYFIQEDTGYNPVNPAPDYRVIIEIRVQRNLDELLGAKGEPK